MTRLLLITLIVGLTSAPGFDLPDVSGRRVSASDLSGSVILLTFWSTRCQDCKLEINAFESLHKKYARAGLAVIGINLDGSDDGVRRYLLKAGITFTVLMDRDGKVADAYGVRGIPSSFIIDKGGAIRYKHFGFDSEAEYVREIEELLNNQK